MILLVSKKIVTENLIKVIQYFQNYYPQNYDGSCTICTFLYSNITDNLKKWMGDEVNTSYMAKEFFMQMCTDYEERVKNFQITRVGHNGQNQSTQNENGKGLQKKGYNVGITSVLNKTSKNDKGKLGFNIRTRKGKSTQPIPIWRVKPPEDKDKFEWKEKAYRKYLEHI